MQDYLTQKRARTQADIQTWLRDRPWDTYPVTAAQAAEQNFAFDAATGRIGTDGCFNGGTVLELPSSVDGVRVRRLASYAMVSYTYLDTLILPDSIETAEPYAFYDKVHLRSTNLPRGLAVIPEDVFALHRSDGHRHPGQRARDPRRGILPVQQSGHGRHPRQRGAHRPLRVLNVRRVIYHGSAKGFPGRDAGN